MLLDFAGKIDTWNYSRYNCHVEDVISNSKILKMSWILDPMR